ncbi:phosphotransferase family protein [Oleomonas cavernae]|uniref:Phosphotransferase family protein n=1 Tax=Oleomonas cavernae TaxID=2320859 RepID=A0A418WFW4_9PROT|nr:phosphotransferase family protein [Oleomonas cavernae]RJF88898.1 phosphotransferase family protein [Oleomonas cavernae]
MEVTAAPAVPGVEAALAALAPRLAAGATGVCAVRRLSGGASQETWAFETSGGERFILRRAPSATWKSEMSIDLETEAILMQRAGAAGVPSPRVRHVLVPEDGLGKGFIMGFVAGETLGQKILRDPALDAVRPDLARQCGTTMAAIHRIDTSGIVDLKATTARSQVDDLAAAHRAGGWVRPVFDLALRWLQDRCPATVPHPTLVHGDFRNGNLIIGADGIRAVLDWELAHQGDPMEDLGWICVNSWRFGEIDKPVGGFGNREDLFAAYEAAGGTVDPARVRFWQAVGTLRWGIICADSTNRFSRGDDPSIERAVIGRRTSETELDLIDLMTGND